MKKAFGALVILVATVSASAHSGPWTVLRDSISAVDGKRSFVVFATRGDVTISVGCDVDGPMVNVSVRGARLGTNTRLRGAYRVDSNPPVPVTWDGVENDGGGLFDTDAKSAIPAMLDGRVWHIRIGHEERSIDLQGVETFAKKVKEACGL